MYLTRSRFMRFHLPRPADAGLLVLRAGLGLSLMFTHGAETLFGGPEAWASLGSALFSLGVPRGHLGFGLTAAAVEFVCGGLLVLGLYARPALVLLLATTAIATLARVDGVVSGAHAADLAIAFTGLLLTGPGRFSFDAGLDRCPLVVARAERIRLAAHQQPADQEPQSA